MQHEGELRSDIDHLIDILRSNPQTKFTVTKLHALTGFPISFLKKWIEVLEEQGHVRFFYNISDEEFSWDAKTRIEKEKKASEISAPKKIAAYKQPVLLREYTENELNLLLEDINSAISQTKKLRARIETLKKSRNSDLAAIGISEHKLEEKRKLLTHLAEQAKKLKS